MLSVRTADNHRITAGMEIMVAWVSSNWELVLEVIGLVAFTIVLFFYMRSRH